MQATGFLDSYRKENLLVSFTNREISALREKELIYCFFNSINKCSSKPAILSPISDHSDSLILKSVSPELPDVLGCNLYVKSLGNANYPTLPKKAEDISKGLQVTKKQQALVE